MESVLERVKTSDLYHSAYLLSNGAKLEEIRIKGKSGRNIEFEFTGDNITKLTHEYISGDATVNLRYLKSSLNHLRDIIFERTRER
jgi:hypothetical protein